MIIFVQYSWPPRRRLKNFLFFDTREKSESMDQKIKLLVVCWLMFFESLNIF